VTFTSSTHGKNLPHVTPKLGTSAKLAVELFQRNEKLFVLSIDSVEGPLAWSKDIRAYNGRELTEKVPSPTVEEINRNLAILFGYVSSKKGRGVGVGVKRASSNGLCHSWVTMIKIVYPLPSTIVQTFDEILRMLLFSSAGSGKQACHPR
jgi:alkyl hydroperoxide reductase subunit AhpC